MAVGLAAPRSNSARVDPHDHHHATHSHSHNQHKATHSTSHRSHSHWWHFGHKKTQPQDDEVSTAASHHHSHHSAAAAKARYQRHHTTDSIPAIPEHRPTAFSKRGSVTLLQHEDPRTVTKRKRIVLHAIFKC